MSKPELVEDFFGVYLLYCINPKYKGRTYIGYTRDPNRRIMQHNRGTWAGGAYRTSNKGPWKMTLIVHGFPNNIAALRNLPREAGRNRVVWRLRHCCPHKLHPGYKQHMSPVFEWAWQNPTNSIRLQHLNLKKIPRKESEFQFKLRVMLEMLRVGPWCRLPLIIRWLEEEYIEEFPIERKPPDHMKICRSPVKSRNLKKMTQESNIHIECLLCSNYINNNLTKIICSNQNCDLVCHITCLADLFVEPGEYIPIGGNCPFCNTYLKWGDLIRKMRGCNDTGTNNSDMNDEVEDNADEEIEHNLDDDFGDEVYTQDREFVDNNSRWFVECDEDL